MAEPQTSILVVDDDVALAKVLCALLAQAGYKAITVPGAEPALSVVGKGGVDLVLTDVRMPGAIDGFGLLQAIKDKWPDVPVVMMTAFGTVTMAVEAMKKGAADFVVKPVEREALLATVTKALEVTRPDREATPRHSAGEKNAGGLFGTTAAMEEARSIIARVASATTTVLLRGENGTGKEVAARELHSLSARARAPFLAVNCAAITESLLESEIFGYEKETFSGGSKDGKPGRVELAEGGTLFLDEIGDISGKMQINLLRLLQEKTFERVGGAGKTRKADVRFVAATHRNLEEMVKAGTFREDLYFRLKVVQVWLPPLRERVADIAPLAKFFAARFGQENGRPNVSLDPGAVAVLEAQPWRGNVRELQNFLEGLVVLSPHDLVTAADVERELKRGPPGNGLAPAPVGGAPGSGHSLGDQRKDAERKGIDEALRQARGNRTLAAKLLGVSRRTLYNKLAELGIDQEAAK